jgi:hypothetical protein
MPIFQKKQLRTPLLVTVLLSAVTLFAVGQAVLLTKHADAANTSNFNPEYIISDTNFTNKNSMTVDQIQQFLQSKNSVCLTQLKTLSLNDTNNDGLGDEPYGKGINEQVSAAQLIWQAAQLYNVNPQVILATLQKEQGLITRTDCPDWRYNTALGYGCPDTEPCDNSAYGFTRQIDYGTWHFRGFYTDTYPVPPTTPGYKSIAYNPDGRCGAKVINIQNRATAALYSYTPYQPNAATLAAAQGQTVDCGAYGNLNFWRYYTDWFGATTEPPVYSWAVESQQISVDGQAASVSNIIKLAPGRTGQLIIRARNTGNMIWQSDSMRIATSRPSDRTSPVQDISWLSANRPAKLKETSVAPGEVGTFEFTIKAPNTLASYREYFNLLIEGRAWLLDPGLYYDVQVENPQTPFYNVQVIDKKLYTDTNRTNEVSSSGAEIVKNGGKLYALVRVKNIGNQPLTKASTYLATTVNRDRTSLFQDPSWLSTNRIAALQEDSVAPNTIGTFKFTLSAPNTLNYYIESFGVVVEGKGWADNEKAAFGLRTIEPFSDSLNANQSLPADKYLRSSNWKYTLVAQSDGNLVLYNSGRAIWTNNNAGRGANNLTLQGDGNLVSYNNFGAIWATNTAGRNATNMILQDDGNLVIYNNGRAIWSTDTNGR